MSERTLYEYTCDGCGKVVTVPWAISNDDDEATTTPQLVGWVSLWVKDESNYKNKVALLACPECARGLVTMFEAAMEKLTERQAGTSA